MKKLLKFYADWCGPCKQQSKFLDNLSIPVESIDVEDGANESLIEKYGIRNLPTLIIIDKDGNELKRFAGLTKKDVIENYLQNNE